MFRRFLLLLFLLPVPAIAQDRPRFEVGALFTYVFLEEIGTRDIGPGTGAGGLGGRIVCRIIPHLDLDADLIFHPNAGVSGSRFQGFAGVKAGKRFNRFGLFAKARPGFLYFSRDPFGVGVPGSSVFARDWASSMDLSVDLGGVIEFYTSTGPIVRFDIGDTVISYGSRTIVSQLQPPRDVGGFTAHNRQWSFGVSFPF